MCKSFSILGAPNRCVHDAGKRFKSTQITRVLCRYISATFAVTCASSAGMIYSGYNEFAEIGSVWNMA